MGAKSREKLIEQVKSELGDKKFEKLVQDARSGKLNVRSMLKVSDDGGRNDAKAQMAALMLIASEITPDSIVLEKGQITRAYYRGKRIEQGEGGTWHFAPKKAAGKKVTASAVNRRKASAKKPKQK